MHIENKKVTYNFTIRGIRFKIIIFKDFIRVHKEANELTTLIPSQLRNILIALDFKVFNVSTYTSKGYKILYPTERFNLSKETIKNDYVSS